MTTTGGAVVLFSGGMDSTYCLATARSCFRRVHALAIDYGQRHAQHELLAARRIAAKLEVPLAVCSMRLGTESALTTSQPLEPGRDEEGISHAFVPGRNLFLLTLAAAHARKVDAATVIIGCCADDAEGFPDCRRSFLDAAEVCISRALGRKLRIESPLTETFKRDMVADALASVRALLDESWSCYTPAQNEPCLSCDACRLRAKAFA